MIIGEMVLSAFLQALFQTLLSAPLKNFFKRRELNEDVPERLNTALLTISAVLIDAEEKQITNPSVEKWVNELRDAVYHAEDALDDIATEALRLNIVAESSSSSNRLRQLRGRISLGDYLDGNSEHLEIRLEKVTMRLERLASQRNVLGLKELTAMIPKQRLPTTSLVVESEVFGRNGDKDELMRFLIPENGDDYGLAVVAIVGTGGVGKTTLSQLLYNDQSVQTHFGTRVWAHVSEEFDVFKITKKVYESVTSRPCEFTDLDVLQVKLKERLIGLPFLLVLDDLWNENFADWDLLRQPFISAPGGSRILVTTRSQRVASIMCSVHVHNLQQLSDGDCWSLFMRTVYGNQDPCLDQEIGDLAERIVHKCRGLPLAVKTLGGMLRFEGKVEEWERVLSSRIWDLPADKSNLLPVLRVSYYYLPAHLKRCFAYCSIFPKGHAFEKEKVVLLWMAEGFLQQTRSNKNLEELGEEYFSELESRSLFQKTKTRYMMHDFINELSQFASGEFSSKFENGCKLQISERTRYLSYLRDNYGEPMEFEALREVKFLRTFLPLSLTNSSRSCCFDTVVSEKLVPMFTRLRVLSLSHYKIARLPPDFFRNLSHARFLDLSRTELEKLPKSLCYMYNLQTLLLAYCSSLKELPTDFCNLINLRYLDLVGTKLRQMPRRFGRLKSLQTLTTFFVSASDGARICELGELNELHGKLRIVELQRVVDVADAAGANLNSKKYLKEIDFVWRSGSSSLESNTNPHRMQNETEVFENLRPHRYIKKLAIERYSGRRFPEWLSDPSFSRIMCIRLSECQNCSTLPSLGQLPGLKELYISGIAGLRSIGPGFYFNNPSLRDREQQAFRSLEMLRFDNMPDLEVLLDIRVARGDLFPSLKKLFILRCPELTGNLPTFLPSLTSLHIHKCGLLDFQPDHYEYSYQNLQTLSIKSSCDSLVTFPLGHFVNLDKLDIDNCISLQTLQIQNEHLYGLSALRKLRINDCQNLQRLPELSSLSQRVQVTVTNCRYLRQPMEQQQPQYQHPQFPLSRLNVSGSQRSHSHGSVRSYGSRSPSRYD